LQNCTTLPQILPTSRKPSELLIVWSGRAIAVFAHHEIQKMAEQIHQTKAIIFGLGHSAIPAWMNEPPLRYVDPVDRRRDEPRLLSRFDKAPMLRGEPVCC
jgi:hypothetical protein